MYYLPIKIRENKLHVCHLDNSANEHMPIYNFLFDKQETTLVTIDKGQAQLISSNRCSENVPLTNCHFLPVEKLEESFKYIHNNGYEITEKYIVYRLTIISPSLYKQYQTAENAKKIEALKNGATIENKIGEQSNQLDNKQESINLVKDQKNSYIYRLKIDKSQIKDERFIVEVVYKEAEAIEYKYRFRCAYMLHPTDKIAAAALDFGSEASQMKCDIDGGLVQLVREFKEIAFPKDEAETYRQGNIRDYLFKSIFFLNKNLPKTSVTRWADRPLQYGRNSLVQTLISMNEKNGYEQWIQLPNLKLLELIGGDLRWRDPIIQLPEGSNVAIANLTFPADRKNLLRIILSQFLYVAMKVQQGRGNYLNFILLVPNVYLQKKIHEVICGLYQDFDFIRLQQEEFNAWKGLEVQVISESDASFSGYIQSRQQYQRGKKHSLIIDIGKGTTDFSIMLGDENDYTKFQSVYRAGIPIAGNMMTYAYYEALKAWLNKNGVTIDDKLRNAPPDKLIDFMDKMESLKLNHEHAQGEPSHPNVAELKRLEQINTYIEDEIISKSKCLPDIDEKLKVRCNQITDYLHNYLNGFITNNKIHFDNVILMGRGILLKPLFEAVKEMIIQNGWADDNAFLTTKGNAIKTQCLQGALYYKNLDVNCQSGLIGSVSFGDNANGYVEEIPKLKRFIKRLTGRKTNPINEEFFYNGAHCFNNNPMFNISCFSQQLGGNNDTDVHVYFIGDGFLVQQNDNAYLLDENNFNRTFQEDVIYKSLFPYWEESIPDPRLENVTIPTRPEPQPVPEPQLQGDQKSYDGVGD